MCARARVRSVLVFWCEHEMKVASRRPRESTLVQKYRRMNTLLVFVFVMYVHRMHNQGVRTSRFCEVAIAVRLDRVSGTLPSFVRHACALQRSASRRARPPSRQYRHDPDTRPVSKGLKGTEAFRSPRLRWHGGKCLFDSTPCLIDVGCAGAPLCRRSEWQRPQKLHLRGAMKWRGA